MKETDELISSVVSEEMSFVKKELNFKKMMEQANWVVEDLCEDYIHSEVVIIAENAIKNAHEELELKIESLKQRYIIRKCYFLIESHFLSR